MREEQAREAELASDALKEVRLALARIDAGTFGLCENGGERIDEKRLEAIPGPATAARTRPTPPLAQARAASRCDETPRRSPVRQSSDSGRAVQLGAFESAYPPHASRHR